MNGPLRSGNPSICLHATRHQSHSVVVLASMVVMMVVEMEAEATTPVGCWGLSTTGLGQGR